MRTVIDILEELEETAGSLAKRDVLEAARNNDLLKRVFVAAQDPYTVYYVNKFTMPKPLVFNEHHQDDDRLDAFLTEVLPLLSSRRLTGNAAKEAVERIFNVMDKRLQKWCQRILLKNLRVGVQESTVNKVWPGLVKSFAVALAETLKSDFVKGEGIRLLEEVTYPVRVEPKLDGLRCIAVKQTGTVTFYTRNGTVLESMPKIKASLEAGMYDDVVLDGEAMAKDWNESASVVMSKTQKDDSNLVYNVFDAMPLADWVAQKTNMPYHERVRLVSDTVDAIQNVRLSPVRQVPHIVARDEAELKAYFAKCMDEGYEGVMLKKDDASYRWKRSDNILKLKPVMTQELVIVGHYEGRRGTKREGQFGGFEAVATNGVVTRIGGGFSDALKAEIQLTGPETYIGRICECECQPDPQTRDGLTVDGKLRFPVFCRWRDESDVDPKVMAAYHRFER